MTYYQGGKQKYGEEIADIIMSYADEDIVGYCEPFCGMLGVYNHILDYDNNWDYLAGDRNPYVIKLWKKLKAGWIPPSKTTEDEYYKLKDQNGSDPKTIFLGFSAAYRGDYFSSYFPKNNIYTQSERCKSIGKKLKRNKVFLSDGEYDQFSELKKYVIYLDPPYKGKQNPYKIKEKKDKSFDYNKFCRYAMNMSKNNLVFISEQSLPFRKTGDIYCKKIWNDGKEKLYLISTTE